MGMNAIESEIFDSIQRLDEPVHSRKIAEYTGFDISDCSRAMYRLKKLELIEQVGEEKLGGIGGRLVPTYMATHRLEQYEKGEALRQMTDEVRADLMEQSVEEIATHLDGSLELELDSLMDRIAAHVLSIKMYRDGGV